MQKNLIKKKLFDLSIQKIINNRIKEIEKRKSMYWECQALCNFDGGAIVYAFNQYVGAGSKKLAHGEDVAGNWESDGNKLSERWWFA